MTNKELRKMGRSELLQILILQMEENEALRRKLEAATEELESRQLAVGNAGSLAEAALQINGVFAAAEAAAEQYLDNVRTSSLSAPSTVMAVASEGARQRHKTQEECRRMREECRTECENMRASCMRECENMRASCMRECEQMRAQAKADGEKMLAHFKEESRKIYESAAAAYKAAKQGSAPSESN
ncbi:MAG: hypothetical protein IJC45_08385 [Clostridia bacterium]|nr:hypothetical protein [Clostridia bacterium]